MTVEDQIMSANGLIAELFWWIGEHLVVVAAAGVCVGLLACIASLAVEPRHAGAGCGLLGVGAAVIVGVVVLVILAVRAS